MTNTAHPDRPDRPVVVVLTRDDLGPPPNADTLAELVTIRTATAETLADALPGARALFVWDFFNPALADAWPAADALEWVHVAAAGVDAAYSVAEDAGGVERSLADPRGTLAALAAKVAARWSR